MLKLIIFTQMCSILVSRIDEFKCARNINTLYIHSSSNFSFSNEFRTKMLVIINAIISCFIETIRWLILYANVLNLWLSMIIPIEKIGYYVMFNFLFEQVSREIVHRVSHDECFSCKNERITDKINFCC